MLLGILTGIIMVLWILPAYLKAPKDYRLDKKFIIKTILAGLVGFIVALILQMIGGYLFVNVIKIPEDSPLYEFIKAFIIFALIEELMKFSIGSFYVKKSKFQSKFDYMLIFTLVAFGFTLIETTIFSSAAGLAGILRAFFPFHIMWQIFMGAHLYEYKIAKRNNDSKTMKKELILAFAVPILMHGCCDFSTSLIERFSTLTYSTIGTLDILSLILPLIFMLFLIIFTVVTEIKFYKYCKNL